MTLRFILVYIASFTYPLMKGGVLDMILITFLIVTLLILLAIVTLAVGAGGALFIVIFGDVIVCIALLIYLIKWLFKKK